jgi:hypothetical protein
MVRSFVYPGKSYPACSGPLFIPEKTSGMFRALDIPEKRNLFCPLFLGSPEVSARSEKGTGLR